jgi:uncharacterized protein YndB with AHSA1/START domain
MAVTTYRTTARPEDVWDVLADAFAYADWVVGCKRIRAADVTWPQPGSQFHHTVGVGPVSIDDRSEVVAAEPARRLVLRAHAGPLGTGRVELELEPAGDGTLVTIREWPEGRVQALVDNPLLELLVDRRNARSIRRLSRLAEDRRVAAAVATG